MSEISKLAESLGITQIQLAKLQAKYRRVHGEESEGKLLIWLREAWSEKRERRWLLSRRGVPPYTESPSEAMTDAGEAPDPAEIDSYRASRQARDRYQDECLKEVGELVAAMRDLRSAIDSLPTERKQSMSRVLWTLKGRLDQAEREIRRRLAA